MWLVAMAKAAKLASLEIGGGKYGLGDEGSWSEGG